jgi:hypothetical protein
VPARKQSLILNKSVSDHTDYILKGRRAWLDVENLTVRVLKTDEGVVVDIWPLGEEFEEPIATTYALFNEGAPTD